MKDLDESTITFTDDARHFRIGDALTLVERLRWYVRVWRWVKRVILRRKPPGPMYIADVNYDAGVITVATIPAVPGSEDADFIVARPKREREEGRGAFGRLLERYPLDEKPTPRGRGDL